MRTLQVALRFRRATVIGLAIILILATGAGLLSAMPSKAAKRPSSRELHSLATPSFVQRPPSSLTDWPMFGNNPTHSGANASEAMLNLVTVPGLSLTWHTDISVICSCHTGWSPAVVGGIVYVEAYDSGNFKGYLVALDEISGRLLWIFTVDGNMESTPAVVNGVIFVTNYTGTLYALNATTGTQIWSHSSVSAGALVSPTVVNGIVYVGGTAVDAKTGKLLWNYIDTTGGTFESSAAVVNGVVYLVSQSGYLFALNASTGALLWKYTGSSGKYVWTSPVVVNGIVYYAWSNIYAVNATTGALVWQNTHGGSMPAVNNGIVCIGDDAIYAFNAATGAAVWSANPGPYTFASPVVAHGFAYISSKYSNAGYPGDTLYAVNASTGAILWHFTADDSFVPVVANDMVFAITSGSVYAFHPAIRPLTATP